MVTVKFRLVHDTASRDIKRLADRCSASGRYKLYSSLGRQFKAATLATMGAGGTGRPLPWAPLSEAYAQEVGRTYATLILSGKLRDSVKVGAVGANGVDVYSDCDYAAEHQYGAPFKNLPMRPFFPVNPFSNKLTPQAEAWMRGAIARHFGLSR